MPIWSYGSKVPTRRCLAGLFVLNSFKNPLKESSIIQDRCQEAIWEHEVSTMLHHIDVYKAPFWGHLAVDTVLVFFHYHFDRKLTATLPTRERYNTNCLRCS